MDAKKKMMDFALIIIGGLVLMYAYFKGHIAIQGVGIDRSENPKLFWSTFFMFLVTYVICLYVILL
jgi:hypothetical protein